MKILKFGGTSVGSAMRMHQVAEISGNENFPVMIVLSAVSGTTNSLVSIADAFTTGDKTTGLNLILQLEKSYDIIIDELFSTNEKKQTAKEIVKHHFDHLRSFARNGFGLKQTQEVLAQGEMLSTNLFYNFLIEKGKNAVLLNALDFMRVDPDGEPMMDYISEHLKKIIDSTKNTSYFITQGFICRNAKGEITNLKRGGSDYSASLIGAAIGADEIQIWTDIDGMHNNDPRVVNDTRPIRRLSFDEAAELAYFGAKILHPSTINPARKAGIPVRLKNTMDPNAEGTLISENSDKGFIKAVAAKDGITAIRIQSNRMLLAHGFLRKVFEIFERYKTSIDMISTSEVAVSLTIDNESNLGPILEELNEIAKVDVDRTLSIICIVGDNLTEQTGYAARIFSSLKNISVRMVSFGGSVNNVSLLIDTSDKKNALAQLHAGLFNEFTVQQ